MKKSISIIALSALMLFAMSCDKIDIDNTHKPYVPTSGGKTVLIKDFTGVRCVNCPAAAEAAHELQHQFGDDRVFLMSVHAGFLAQPVGSFPDFTTEVGTTWYNNNSSNPLFSVDRVSLTEGNTLFVEQIDTPVSEALASIQTFDISLTNDYNEATRELKVDTKLTAVGDCSGDLYVTVCLLEDSIIGRQVVPGGIDTAYVFRNVFRGSLNGADGDAFAQGQVYANEDYSKSYTTTLDPEYNADQCYILTYISDKNLGGEILQTNMKKVK